MLPKERGIPISLTSKIKTRYRARSPQPEPIAVIKPILSTFFAHLPSADLQNRVENRYFSENPADFRQKSA